MSGPSDLSADLSADSSVSRDEPAWPPMPLHVAVDVVALALLDERLSVLLWRRPYAPFEGDWALPGTFSRPDEGLDASPRRALESKAGLTDVVMEQLATYDQPPRGSAPGRDPRGRVVSVAYLALVPDESPVAESDDLRWFPVDAVPAELAFDHGRILADGVERLQAKAHYSSLPLALLPEPVTLPEVHALYEAVLDQELDVRNFRRDLLAAGVLDETGETRAAGPGRPARLYRRRDGAFAVSAEERRVADRIRGR